MTPATYLWMRPVKADIAEARPAELRQAAIDTAMRQRAEEHPHTTAGQARVHLDEPRDGLVNITVTIDVWPPTPPSTSTRPPRTPSKPRRRPTAHDQAHANTIVAEVAEQHNLPPEAITGRARTPARVIEARRQVAVRLRQEGWSLPQIGAAVNRDHTTVLDQLRKAGAA